jgi:hypothetical protein
LNGCRVFFPAKRSIRLIAASVALPDDFLTHIDNPIQYSLKTACQALPAIEG